MRERESFVGGISLPILSASLLILAHPPFRLLLLPFVALVPLAFKLGSLSPGPGSGRKAANLGLVFGLVYWGVLLVWVPLVVAPQFPWAYPGFLAQVGLLSGLTALMAWGTHRLHSVARLPLFLAFSLAWVSMEWFKAHFPLGLSFPWLGLGISLTSWPALLGIAEWTGEGGVAFWLAGVNGVLATGVVAVVGERVRPGIFRRRWPTLVLALLASFAPGVLGVFRARTLPLREGPVLAVVGTDVPRSLRLHPRESTVEGLAQVRRRLEDLDPGAADMVILPEATVSIPLDGIEGRVHLQALGEMAARVHGPILVGALGMGPGGTLRASGELTNSAFLIGPDSVLSRRYDKVRMVPGMEWGGYSPGEAGVVFSTSGFTLGPLICYESLFGALAREQVRAGAQVLVNVSSDVWFGEGSRGFSSLFLHQHATHLVMRAVETRTGVARAANGGFSFLLGPTGERLSEILPPQGGMALAAVPILSGSTFFVRTGDLVGPGAVLSVIFLLIFSAIRARRPGGLAAGQDPRRGKASSRSA